MTTTETSKLYTVYALKNLTEKDGELKEYGYLLFISEEKADQFLDFIAILQKHKTSYYKEKAIYTKFQHIEVNEFYYKKTQSSPNFFVKHLDYVKDLY